METERTLPVTLYGKKCKVESFDEGDVFRSTVICPHCGRYVLYDAVRNYRGKGGCDSCIKELTKVVDKAVKKDPDNWYKTDFEPYGVNP